MIQAIGHKKFYNKFDKFYRARFVTYPNRIIYSRKCFDTASEAEAYGKKLEARCKRKVWNHIPTFVTNTANPSGTGKAP